MFTLEQLKFDNTYITLPDEFHSSHEVQSLLGQHLVHFNNRVANKIGLKESESNRLDFVERLFGNKPLSGAEPIALCYAGHQFGHFVPRLGDGRAILLGEIKTDEGNRWDLQVKGGGPTLYSRNGDGRAVLRSTIREYLCSAAMNGLNIPTTHALCMTASTDEVYREQIETGSMLLRVAPSHIRFGSFEYFYYKQQFDDLKVLADYTIDHHFFNLRDETNPYLSLLKNVIHSTAQLIAKWQSVGFSHGVMNTDNMSVHGLTLDYGPYGFLDNYDPDYICNHSDHSGRYAFNKQPDIGLFNLSCFAQTLLPLINENTDLAAEQAKVCLEEYKTIYVSHYAQLMRLKLGFETPHADDKQLCGDLLYLLQVNNVDYTLFFRQLSQMQSNANEKNIRNYFIDQLAFDAWYERYKARIKNEKQLPKERSEKMLQVNPKFILRNYIAESIIRKVTDDNDYQALDDLMTILQTPYDEHSGFQFYADHPPGWAGHIEVSCSS